MTNDVPGTSLSQDDLDALPFKPAMPPAGSASAKLIADRYLESHVERPLDPRISSHEAALKHVRDETGRALLGLGFTETYAGEIGEVVASVPVWDDPIGAAERIMANRTANEPRRRSADHVVANHQARSGRQ